MSKLFYNVLFFEVLLVPFIFLFQATDTFQGPKALVFYAAAVLLAGGAGYAVLRGRGLKANVPALLAWLAFTVAAAATLFFAKDKYVAVFGDRHVESVAFYVAGLATLLGAAQVSRAEWRKLLGIVVYQGPLFSLLVLVQSFFQLLTFDYSSSVLTRGDGATGNPIYASYFLVFTVAATLWALCEATSTWRRAALSVFLFLELWAITMTDSRSGWIGVGVVFGVFFVWGVAQRLRPVVAAAATTAAVFVVLLGLFSPVLRVSSPPTVNQAAGSQSAGEQSIVERVGVWKFALATFASHPVLGVGADNFASYYVQHVSVSPNPQDYAAYDQSHNLALQILVTTGVLGGLCMAAFAWFVFRGFWKISEDRSSSDSAAVYVAWGAGLLGIVAAAMFNPLDVVGWTFILLAAGAVLSAGARTFTLTGTWWRTAGVATIALSVLFVLATVSVAVADYFYQAGLQSTGHAAQLADYSRAIAFDPIVPNYYMAYDTAYAEEHTALPPYLHRLTVLEPYSGQTYARNGAVEAYVGYETHDVGLQGTGLADLARGASIDTDYPPTILDAGSWNIVTGNLSAATVYLKNFLALDTTNASVYEALSDVYTKQGLYRQGYDELSAAYRIDPTTSQQLKHVLERAALNGYHVVLPIHYSPSAG